MGIEWKEKDLEDWLDDPWMVAEVLGLPETAIGVAVMRQVVLPTGQRIDLLVTFRVPAPDDPDATTYYFVVVELKAAKVGPDALAQLLSYIAVLKPGHDLLSTRLTDGLRADSPAHKREFAVRGALVGPCFDPAVTQAVRAVRPLIACHEVEVSFRRTDVDPSWALDPEDEGGAADVLETAFNECGDAEDMVRHFMARVAARDGGEEAGADG